MMLPLWTATKVCVIEPQALFEPALREIFAELGLAVAEVSKRADLCRLLEEQPEIVFIDIEFIPEEPVELVGMIHRLLPQALIALYTERRSGRWAHACRSAGASAILSKSSGRSEIVAGLRAMLERGDYVDTRFTRDAV